MTSYCCVYGATGNKDGKHAVNCTGISSDSHFPPQPEACPHCGCTKGLGPGYITLGVREKEGHILIGTGGELVTALKPGEARQLATDIVSAADFIEAAE